jgi:hypothetical protein
MAPRFEINYDVTTDVALTWPNLNNRTHGADLGAADLGAEASHMGRGDMGCLGDSPCAQLSKGLSFVCMHTPTTGDGG